MRTGALLIVLSFAAGVDGQADTLVVAPDGSGQYATIQDAVSAADSSDVIELLDGTFSGDGNHNIWIYDIWCDDSLAERQRRCLHHQSRWWRR